MLIERVSVFPRVVLVVVLLALVPSGASASEPWSITPINPTDGGSYGVTGPLERWTAEVRSPVLLGSGTQAIMGVAVENVAGQDGTLADDKVVAGGSLFQRDSDRYRFAGEVNVGAFRQPGTYYFQYHARVRQVFGGTSYCSAVPPGTEGSCLYVSPVFSLTVKAAGAPALPAATEARLGRYTAVAKVKSYVVRRLKGRRVRATCLRDDAAQFTCRVRYARAGKNRRAVVEISRDARGFHYHRY